MASWIDSSEVDCLELRKRNGHPPPCQPICTSMRWKGGERPPAGAAGLRIYLDDGGLSLKTSAFLTNEPTSNRTEFHVSSPLPQMALCQCSLSLTASISAG
jgi:hypothetical protein